MRKKINFKLLGGLLAAVVLLGAGVYGMHAVQVGRNASVVLQRANEAEQQGHLDHAAQELKNYLNLKPEDTEAMARYGLVLEKLAKDPAANLRALMVLEQVLRRAPDRTELRRKVARIAMDLERFNDARTHLQFLTESSPDDGELELLLGRCEEAKDHFTEAASWYEKARKHAPEQIDGHVRLAHLLRNRLDQPEGADRIMDEMVKATEKSKHVFRAHLERARYRNQFGLADAASDIMRARALAPEEADVLLDAAVLAQDQGDLAAARKDLERGIQLEPRNRRMYQALAGLETRAGRLEEALSCLRRGLKALPDQIELKWMLADLLVTTGKLNEAKEAITAMRQGTVTGELLDYLDYLDARILIARSQWYEAIQILERIHPKLAAWPDLIKRSHLFLGRCHEQLGDVDRQYKAYRQAAAIDPVLVPARLGMASALVAMGKTEKAIDEYQKLIPQAPGAGFALARLLIDQNLRLPAAQRRWQDVEKVLDEAARAVPNSVESSILRAQVFAAQGQFGRARDLLTTTRGSQPDRIEPWTALAVLAAQEGKAETTLAVLEEAERQLGDRVELRLARAWYWSWHRGPDATKALENLAQGLEKFEGEDRHRLLDGLAMSFARAGEITQAKQLWNQVAQEHPYDLRSRLILLDVALQSNNPDPARQAQNDHAIGSLLDRIRKIEGEEGTLWRYGQVRSLCRKVAQQPTALEENAALLNEARLLLGQIAARRQSWSTEPLAEADVGILVAQADVEDLAGHQDEAIRQFQRAIDLGARNPLAFRRLIQLLYERQRYAQAAQVLQKLQDQTPGRSDLNMMAAELSLRTENPAHALELARKAVSEDSKDYRDLLWLGHVLWSAGHREEAGSVLRQAVELAENVPQTWVALVQYLAAMGQTDQAEAAIQKARSQLPGDQAPLALARCYEIIDRKDQARAQYVAALAAKPEDISTLRNAAMFSLRDGQLRETESHLRKLVALKREAPNDAAWAKRILAVILASDGTPQKTTEALKILSPSDAAAEETVEDLRTRAKILALQKDRSQRHEAITLMEQVVQRGPSTAEDLFLLAQLYERDGEWIKAREQMLTLLATHEKDPRYLAHYVNSLIRRGDIDQAEIWFARLKKLEPLSLRTLVTKTRLLKAQGKGDEAVTLLKTYAQRQDAQLLLIAALLEEMGEIAEAELMYRKVDAQAKHPEDALVLARFLGRQHRPREALDICERAWRTCPPAVVGNTCALVLSGAKAKDEQFSRVEGWLDKAIQNNPNSVSLLFDLANLRVLAGRTQDAEAIYRRIHERHKDSGAPLNNLAWLLALQGGRGSEALDLINRAIAIEGRTPDLLDTRAVVEIVMGQSGPAIKDLEGAVAVSPSAVMYFHLAQAYLLAGNRADAAKVLEKATALGLEVDSLHPLEQPAYHRLLSELARH